MSNKNSQSEQPCIFSNFLFSAIYTNVQGTARAAFAPTVLGAPTIVQPNLVQ